MTLPMDKIFKALTDPTRRAILDRLREADGQSLSDLEDGVQMTRFGVMKHLRVLEDAGLIVTVKKGRFKYHYLNAVPLQEVIDRWVEPLIAAPTARGLLNLKAQLEEREMLDMTPKPDFVHQTLIRCSQDALWDALTRADQVAQYHFMCSAADGDMIAPGDAQRMIRADGSTMLVQRATTLTPKTRIELTFEPNWEGGAEASRVVFLIDPEGPHCKLTVEHYDIPEGQDGVREGWARQIASLKSWLETGTPIKVPN